MEKPGLAGQFLAWAGSDMFQIDAKECEKKINAEYPILQAGEKVEMAFKDGRDKTFFTSKRIIVRDVQGLLGKKILHQSIPYETIKAFAVTTGANFLDWDTEMMIWTEMSGLSSASFNFMKGRSDILAIQNFMTTKILSPERAISLEAPAGGADPSSTLSATGFLDWMGGNAAQIDSNAAEQQLRQTAPTLLQEDETVELAFKSGRDSIILTTKRILMIDVQGITGGKIEYKTVLYSAIKAFSVQSAGGLFDRDSEMYLHTSVRGMGDIYQELRKGGVDLFGLQRYLADKVLGTNIVAPAGIAGASAAAAGGGGGAAGDMMAWLGQDAKQIDAAAVNAQLHSAIPILQDGEIVEMAFQVGRDKMLITTKRIIMIDVKGFSGKKVEYLTLPFKCIGAFAVETAGGWDTDSEIKLWTSMYPISEELPGLSYIKQDLRKNMADIFAVQQLLALRILESGSLDNSNVSLGNQPPAGKQGMDGAMAKFGAWLGDNASEIDAAAVTAQLRTNPPVLQMDEVVEVALKVGRDMTLLTNKRAMVVDVQGWSGKKVEYRSVPYKSVRAFCVQSAGAGFDRDAEMFLYLGAPAMSYMAQDLRKGKCDIFAIHRTLSRRVLNRDIAQAEPIQGGSSGSTGADDLMGWLGGDARQIDAAEADRQLHTSPKLLQDDEHVELAFKIARDTLFFTNKRIISVDVQGLLGKKIAYITLPYPKAAAYSVQSAGQWDNDSEMKVYTFCSAMSIMKQDLRRQVDIFALQSFLTNKLIGR